jgi:hypothetical protein
MPHTLDSKVDEWRDADRRAREIEKALACLPFVKGESGLPAELVTEARALRKLADEKLKAAIDAIRPAS